MRHAHSLVHGANGIPAYRDAVSRIRIIRTNRAIRHTHYMYGCNIRCITLALPAPAESASPAHETLEQNTELDQ